MALRQVRWFVVVGRECHSALYIPDAGCTGGPATRNGAALDEHSSRSSGVPPSLNLFQSVRGSPRFVYEHGVNSDKQREAKDTIVKLSEVTQFCLSGAKEFQSTFLGPEGCLPLWGRTFLWWEIGLPTLGEMDVRPPSREVA